MFFQVCKFFLCLFFEFGYYFSLCLESYQIPKDLLGGNCSINFEIFLCKFKMKHTQKPRFSYSKLKYSMHSKYYCSFASTDFYQTKTTAHSNAMGPKLYFCLSLSTHLFCMQINDFHDWVKQSNYIC